MLPISESGDTNLHTAAIPTTPEVKEPRYFYLDNTFAIFLSENGKSLPYFAGRIEDISKFQ